MTNGFVNKKYSSEKELFDAIAKSYARKDLYPSSRIARKFRLNQTVSDSKISKNSEILEVGCGAGYSSVYLSGKYLRYTGIDFSSKLISYAERTHKLRKAKFMAEDLYKFKPEKKFDLIFMIGVLHHMQNIPLALRICKSFLKKGGMIAVNEPRDSNPFIGMLRWIRKRLDSSYSVDQRELKEMELVRFFKEAGMNDIKTSPQGFFSTPFAEVIIKPRFIFQPVSSFFCRIDRLLERISGKITGKLSWNIIITGINSEE